MRVESTGIARVEPRGSEWWEEAIRDAAVTLNASEEMVDWLTNGYIGTIVTFPIDLTDLDHDQLFTLNRFGVGNLGYSRLDETLGVQDTGIWFLPTRVIVWIPTYCDPGEEFLITLLSDGRAESDLIKLVDAFVDSEREFEGQVETQESEDMER